MLNNINLKLFLLFLIPFVFLTYEQFVGSEHCEDHTIQDKRYHQGGHRTPSQWQLRMFARNGNYLGWLDVIGKVYDKVEVDDSVTICMSPVLGRVISLGVDGVRYNNSMTYINIIFYFLIPITAIPVFGYLFKLLISKKQ
jgi:hypothetical protein